MNLSFSELRDLVAALNQSDVAELTLKSADFELTLRKQSAPAPVLIADAATRLPAASTSSGWAMPSPAPAPQPATAQPSAASTPPPTVTSDLLEITSPMVGTFYRSPAPNESPFVNVGDRIQSGQTVCIIEAMKLMNELEAEISGEVVEILVENSDPVEFGQPLMRVKPS